jgi:hypothetical protein
VCFLLISSPGLPLASLALSTPSGSTSAAAAGKMILDTRLLPEKEAGWIVSGTFLQQNHLFELH